MGREIDGDLRKVFKTYLGNWDLPADGSDLEVTISKIELEEVRNKNGTVTEQPIIYFAELDKPLICNQENNKRLTKLLGPREGTKGWYGERIALRREANAQSEDGYCVRVNPRYKPKATEVICEKCGKPIKPIDGYSVNKIVLLNKERYGQALCVDCAQARKEADK